MKNQVRSMVGCLKYLGEKKWNLKKFAKIIKMKDLLEKEGMELGKVYTDKDLQPFKNPNKEKEMFEELDLIKSICREFNEIPRGRDN